MEIPGNGNNYKLCATDKLVQIQKGNNVCICIYIFFKFGKTMYWQSISRFVFLNRNKKVKYVKNHENVKKKKKKSQNLKLKIKK